MNKFLFTCCFLSFYSCFAMDQDVADNYKLRHGLRSSVVGKINSIDTNIDMVRSLSGDCIDENKAQSYINDKTAEMIHLIDALHESDELAILASKIDSSIECASALRGMIDDATLDMYLYKMQKEYEATVAKSRIALED